MLVTSFSALIYRLSITKLDRYFKVPYDTDICFAVLKSVKIRDNAPLKVQGEL